MIIDTTAGQSTARVAEQETFFSQLVSLRRQIASELKLPPYIIFYDKTLHDMCRILYTYLETLSTLQGKLRRESQAIGEDLYISRVTRHGNKLT